MLTVSDFVAVVGAVLAEHGGLVVALARMAQALVSARRNVVVGVYMALVVLLITRNLAFFHKNLN